MVRLQGFGEAGHELTTGGIDTLIFVGSVDVGRKVQEVLPSLLKTRCVVSALRLLVQIRTCTSQLGCSTPCIRYTWCTLGGVDTLIFVGSVDVGRTVHEVLLSVPPSLPPSLSPLPPAPSLSTFRSLPTSRLSSLRS